MKRKAFVGFSGPIFYDYKNTTKKTSHERASSPNPLLDSPGMLSILYDEIWFLSPALCPDSMRGLNFVKFVVPDGDRGDLLKGLSWDEYDFDYVDFIDDREDRSIFFKNYDSTLRSIGVSWLNDSAIDQHSHQLDIPNIPAQYASSISPKALFVDQVIVDHLGPSYELYTNTYAARWLSPQRPTTEIERSVVDELLIRDIPSALTKTGPTPEIMLEMRAHGNIAAFRDWMSAHPHRVSRGELQDIQESVQAAIDGLWRAKIKSYLPEKFFLSTVRTAFDEMIGLFVPGYKPAIKLAKTIGDYSDHKRGRWTAFIADVTGTRPRK